MHALGTDYDGVIINIEPQKAQAFGKMLNKHWGVDTKEAAEFWLATGGTSRKYKFDYFYDKSYHKELSEKEYYKVEHEYSTFLKEKLYPHVTLLPGAKDFLEYTRKHFDFTFIASGIPMQELQHLVALNDVAQYFDVVLGTNQEYPSKRAHFKKIQQEKNPTRIIFFADSTEDMKIASEFPNTTAIGVLTNHSEKKLKEAGANMTVNNLNEALQIIKNSQN